MIGIGRATATYAHSEAADPRKGILTIADQLYQVVEGPTRPFSRLPVGLLRDVGSFLDSAAIGRFRAVDVRSYMALAQTGNEIARREAFATGEPRVVVDALKRYGVPDDANQRLDRKSFGRVQTMSLIGIAFRRASSPTGANPTLHGSPDRDPQGRLEQVITGCDDESKRGHDKEMLKLYREKLGAFVTLKSRIAEWRKGHALRTT